MGDELRIDRHGNGTWGVDESRMASIGPDVDGPAAVLVPDGGWLEIRAGNGGGANFGAANKRTTVYGDGRMRSEWQDPHSGIWTDTPPSLGDYTFIILEDAEGRLWLKVKGAERLQVNYNPITGARARTPRDDSR